MLKEEISDQLSSESGTLDAEVTAASMLDYLMVLSRRRWIVIVTVLFTLAFVGLWVSQTPPKYTARTTIRVISPPGGSAEYIDYDTQYAEMVIGTYVAIATSDAMLNQLSDYVSDLPAINVDAVANTELVRITAEDEDPALAQFAANKLAELLIAESRQGVMAETHGSATIYVVEPAMIPTVPSSPSPWLLMVLALGMGLLGGIGLAFLFDSLDTRLYLIDQIESLTEVPVIGNIPNSEREGLLFDTALHAEAFRRLRTNLYSLARDADLKTILITSAVPRDGKSSIAAILAATIARANLEVVLVDADLRGKGSPSIHEFFGMHNATGLSNVLLHQSTLSGAIQQSQIPGLKVLTSGAVPTNPVELLGSQQMIDTLNELARNSDFVLLDSPSSVSVTDPAVLAPLVDCVLLIVRHGWVRREALQATCQHMRNVDARILGVIANRTDLGTHSRFSKQQYSRPPITGLVR